MGRENEAGLDEVISDQEGQSAVKEVISEEKTSIRSLKLPKSPKSPSSPSSPSSSRFQFSPSSSNGGHMERSGSFSQGFAFKFLDKRWMEAPRLVRRNLPYHQSNNKFNVKAKYGKHRWTLLWHYINHDPFHVMLRWSTPVSLTFLLTVWTFFILIFAEIYIAVDRANPHVDCGLHPDGDGSTLDFHTAFAFSVETSTTVGYGLPGGSSAFFQDCSGIQVTIFFQMVFSMVFNATLLAFIFARLGRCETRGHQVLFTSKAVVRKDESGRMLFEVKVFDSDSMHPIVEAHVRMYAVHCGTDRNYIPLRILRPDDELGGMLITSIPTRITHHIDAFSPLMPLSLKKAHNVIDDHGLIMREVDSYTGSSDVFVCPVCGESYATPERLLKHIKYYAMTEEHDDVPVKGSHQELSKKQIKKLTERPKVSYDDVFKYWNETNMEVVVVVEGIDPLISGTFQALQSYQKEDVEYGSKFVPAFTINNEVDLELFHRTENVAELSSTESLDSNADI